MRLRNVKNVDEILKASIYYIDEPINQKGSWSKVFKNDNPIAIEIGMGKGDFITGMALKHPEINYIGIEKYQCVLVRGVQKLDELDIPNVKVMCYDAALLEEVFDREVDTIYLNFSDPWPKTRHTKRRLTYRSFLKVYENISKSDIHIVQKTDNDKLFESSLIELNNYGFIFDELHLDLWNTDKDNVRTEYENKFGNKGFTIKYIDAHKKR